MEGPGQIRVSREGVTAQRGATIRPPFSDVYGPLPGYQMLDSLAVEAEGRVSVATLLSGQITTFDPAGGSYEQIPVPDAMTTNICFGGDDMRTAWITGGATGQLFRMDWPRPGLTLNFAG